MEAVSIVTVKNKIALFKGEEAASNIELIQLEEVGFEIVAQKGLYEIGDKAIYIQPDYCLPHTSIFEEYIAPYGDPKKCKLGSNNRIRAIKFNFHRGDNIVVYSQGILLPALEVENYLATFKRQRSINSCDLTKELEITKWEDSYEHSGSNLINGTSSKFPTGLYRTDETNINNLWNHFKYPVTLIGTEKCDGSSITIYYKNGEIGVCSRNMKKPTTRTIITGRKELSWWKWILTKVGFKFDLNIYEEVDSDSEFVMAAKQHFYDLEQYCDLHDTNIVLRGELNGSNCKGSGNKNNPARKEPMNIKFYGADDWDSPIASKLDEEEFSRIVDKMHLERCKVVFNQSFNSREEIETACNDYFKNNLIEGIVVRTLDSKFSAKFMNPEYDSKK